MSQTNSVLKETILPGRIGQDAISAPLAPDTVLQGRYRIVKQLGKGGMGAVYEAVDERLDATVALKETLSADTRLRQQFHQEARLLAQLNHPALPRVSDYFIEDQRAFLVMQFISGTDLAEIIARQPGPFPRHQVVVWADQLLDALIFLHTRERQIIHRDIKPHNLKLTANGTIALLDFGLAKAQVADRATGDNSIFGYTRRYAPLEQIQDQGTTPQSDIYALGATLYHLLTGIKPADAVVREAALANSLADPLTPANEVHASVGSELAGILSRAMAQNPADRFASASDFRDALAQLGRDREKATERTLTAVPTELPADGVPLKAKPPRVENPFAGYSILKPEESSRSRRPNLVAAVILLVVLTGLIGTLYVYRRWNSSPIGELKTNSDRHATVLAASPQNRQPFNVTNVIGPQLESAREVGFTTRSDSKVNSPDQSSRSTFHVDDPNAPIATPAERGIETAPRVRAPRMRLPETTLNETEPGASFSRLPAFGQPEGAVERQVLRSPDGTQVVRFSDGTTKVYRPGEKNTQSSSPPQ